MRISDWSSDVCSSDLTPQYLTKQARERAGAKLPSMEEAMPETYAELAKVFAILETHYRDMQDIEFTAQQGKLWMLQTRSGKRTAKEALKIALHLANDGLISREEAIARVDRAASDHFLTPTPSTKDPRDALDDRT